MPAPQDDPLPDTTAAALDDEIDAAELAAQLEDEEAGLMAGFDAEAHGGTPQPVQSDGGDEDPDEKGAPESGAGAEGERAPVAGKAATPPPDDAAHDPALDKRIRALEGQVGNLVRRNKELEAALTKPTGAAGSAPSGADITEALRDNKKFEAFAREWPEAAEVLQEMVSLAAGGRGGALPDVASIKTEVRKEVLQEIAVRQLAERYSDYPQRLADPALSAWVESQDDVIKAKWRSDWGTDVADVLDAYVAASTQSAPSGSSTSATPARRLTGSRLQRALPSTTGRAAATGRPIPTEDEAMLQGFNEG